MTQPKALRLADKLLSDIRTGWIDPNYAISAAYELRRLSDVNQELVEALEAFDNAAKESKTIIGFAGRSLKLLTQARAALAKAQGESNEPCTITASVGCFAK